jgi:hypothetical protein
VGGKWAVSKPPTRKQFLVVHLVGTDGQGNKSIVAER